KRPVMHAPATVARSAAAARASFASIAPRSWRMPPAAMPRNDTRGKEAAGGDAEEREGEQRGRERAALRKPSEPVAARPRIRGHAGIAVAQRRIVPRRVLRIHHPPVAGADP